MKPKLLIVELWGVGDLAIATPFLRAAAERFEVTLLAKPFAAELQPRFWPGVRVKTFVAPWTAFRRKYQLHRWPWRELFALRRELRREDFDFGLSARWDPRDHFLLGFFGAEKRLGFPRTGSGVFLTHPLTMPELTAHRYEFWRLAAKSLDIELPPRDQIVFPVRPPSRQVLVHTGARQSVRVWPLENYQRMVQRLRADGHSVQVVCDPDQRERWVQLGESHVVTPQTVTELLVLLDRAGIFIGNDSGPGHLAAASNLPTFTFFGPQLSERFAPLHPQAEWIDGLACPFKPCQDYCRFPTPRCLWDITEESVWPRINAFAQAYLAGKTQNASQSPLAPWMKLSLPAAFDQIRHEASVKLLVFAHTPPPHHGQSYMVRLMLEGFGGDRRKNKAVAPNDFGIECYHVNARFSKAIEDVGEFQGAKLFLIVFYCLQAIWCRFRYGVENFYYVPAPGKAVAVYRDWLVMFICRPFFKKMILHWHAAGLAKWLETSVQIRTRAVTYHLFKPVNLSIVLSKYNFADAEKLLSRRVCVVSNGIPDPCPDFEQSVLPRRRARFAARAKLFAGEALLPGESESVGGDPQTVKVLFLAHCTREKGLFAAIEGVVAANLKLAAQHSPVRMKLFAAGNFVTAGEKEEFDRLMKMPHFAGAVEYLGFVFGAEKERALREADVFCFPTRYLGENQPVSLIEAMAFGLPIVTTRWRSLPEMLPENYPGLVSAAQSPDEITGALLMLTREKTGEHLRENFLSQFVLGLHLARLAAAIRSVDGD